LSQADNHESSFELALALPHSASFWPQLTHVTRALASSICCFDITHLDENGWANFGVANRDQPEKSVSSSSP
jgi:hypothetical protein